MNLDEWITVILDQLNREELELVIELAKEQHKLRPKPLPDDIELLINKVKIHGPVPRHVLVDLLEPSLGRMNPPQYWTNLFQRARRRGLIKNIGSDTLSQWVLP